MTTTEQQNTLTVTKQNKETMELDLVTMEQAVIALTMNDLYLLGESVRQQLTNGKTLSNAKSLYYIAD